MNALERKVVSGIVCVIAGVGACQPPSWSRPEVSTTAADVVGLWKTDFAHLEWFDGSGRPKVRASGDEYFHFHADGTFSHHFKDAAGFVMPEERGTWIFSTFEPGHPSVHLSPIHSFQYLSPRVAMTHELVPVQLWAWSDGALCFPGELVGPCLNKP
jgi:hypothetical protein